MQTNTELVVAIGSVTASLISVICLGIRLSRCSKITLPCCTLERSVIEESQV